MVHVTLAPDVYNGVKAHGLKGCLDVNVSLILWYLCRDSVQYADKSRAPGIKGPTTLDLTGLHIFMYVLIYLSICMFFVHDFDFYMFIVAHAYTDRHTHT